MRKEGRERIDQFGGPTLVQIIWYEPLTELKIRKSDQAILEGISLKLL